MSGSITLSCGKLMTGVTVPEWSSIFMLRSLKAPESYLQAAFRVQSPWTETSEIKKETACIFEFDPNRALSLVALYGTDLADNSLARKRRAVDLYNLNGVMMGRLLQDPDLIAELERLGR